jgi:hypothetical protein
MEAQKIFSKTTQVVLTIGNYWDSISVSIKTTAVVRGMYMYENQTV